MKVALLRTLSLVSLAVIALAAGGCVYAYHEPGRGTQLGIAPPPIVELCPPQVIYAPAPVFYGHGWHHGHWCD